MRAISAPGLASAMSTVDDRHVVGGGKPRHDLLAVRRQATAENGRQALGVIGADHAGGFGAGFAWREIDVDDRDRVAFVVVFQIVPRAVTAINLPFEARRMRRDSDCTGMRGATRPPPRPLSA
jgi:hypothetical protein